MILSMICMPLAIFCFKDAKYKIDYRDFFFFCLTYRLAFLIWVLSRIIPGFKEVVQAPSPIMLCLDYFWAMPVVSVALLLKVISFLFILFNLLFLIIAYFYFCTDVTINQHYRNLLLLEFLFFLVCWSLIGIENYMRFEGVFGPLYFFVSSSMTDSPRRQFSAVAYIIHFFVFYSLMLYGLSHSADLYAVFQSLPVRFQDILHWPSKKFETAFLVWTFVLSLTSELALSRIAHLFPKDETMIETLFTRPKYRVPSEILPLEVVFLGAMFVKIWVYFWLTAVLLVGFYPL